MGRGVDSSTAEPGSGTRATLLRLLPWAFFGAVVALQAAIAFRFVPPPPSPALLDPSTVPLEAPSNGVYDAAGVLERDLTGLIEARVAALSAVSGQRVVFATARPGNGAISEGGVRSDAAWLRSRWSGGSTQGIVILLEFETTDRLGAAAVYAHPWNARLDRNDLDAVGAVSLDLAGGTYPWWAASMQALDAIGAILVEDRANGTGDDGAETARLLVALLPFFGAPLAVGLWCRATRGQPSSAW